MCIFILSTDCPFAGLEQTIPLPVFFQSSRRPSTNEATSSAPSIMSSRSSVTTMSLYSRGSSDSLNEMFPEHPTKHFRIATSEAEPTLSNLPMEEAAANNYITAINTLTNTLESQSGIEVGRCVDPTSPVPSQCKNFQIRHRSSHKRQTGYFDKCGKCTDVGKHWQEGKMEEIPTWEEMSPTSSRVQKVKKAETGMCSTKGCDGCNPARK